jgi:hypothetical protein
MLGDGLDGHVASVSTLYWRMALYLLADSQLLFWNDGTRPFLASMLEATAKPTPSVAYIGASNGDSPEAYSILVAALDQLEIGSPHWVRASFPAADRQALRTADVIVLAGGDVEAGWNVFTRSGMREEIESRYRAGAVLVGVSAGAVQIGTHAALTGDDGSFRLVETFGFVRAIVDAHDENNDWHRLASTIELLEGAATGIGIPRGSGLIAHSDGTLEPIRHAAYEFTSNQGKLCRGLLMP